MSQNKLELNLAKLRPCWDFGLIESDLSRVKSCLLRSPYNNPLYVYLLFYGGATTDTYCPNSVLCIQQSLVYFSQGWRHHTITNNTMISSMGCEGDNIFLTVKVWI